MKNPPPITDQQGMLSGEEKIRAQGGGEGGQWKNPLQGETFAGKALRRENWPAGDEREGCAGPCCNLGKTPSLNKNPLGKGPGVEERLESMGVSSP